MLHATPWKRFNDCVIGVLVHEFLDIGIVAIDLSVVGLDQLAQCGCPPGRCAQQHFVFTQSNGIDDGSNPIFDFLFCSNPIEELAQFALTSILCIGECGVLRQKSKDERGIDFRWFELQNRRKIPFQNVFQLIAVCRPLIDV